MPIPYRITDMRDAPALTVERVGQTDVIVAWLEDGVRPYTLRLPKEDFTPEKAILLVEAEVRRRSALVGRTGEV